MGNTLADIVGKLEAMGTADQIALELEAQGIRAHRKCAHACALSGFIKSNVGDEFKSVGVTQAYVKAYREDHSSDYVLIGGNLTNFVSRFDNGDFPNLVADGDA